MTPPTSARGRRPLSPRPARLAAALASLALLGAGVPAAADAVGWAPGPAFSVAAGSFGGQFSEAPDGSSTATWFTGSEDVAPVLSVQHARPDGTVAAPLTLGAGAYPTMATSTTNLTAVAWIGGHLADGPRTVRVTLLDAGGAIVRTTTVATLTEDEAGLTPSVQVAVDAAGDATVVWRRFNQDSLDTEAEVAHVGADGSATTPVVLGDVDVDDESPPAPSVASVPGGASWVGWVDSDGNAEVARLDGSGAVAIPATVVSTPGDVVSAVVVSASAGGAVAGWVVPDPDVDPGDGGLIPASVVGARLPAVGPLVTGAPFGVTAAADVSAGGVFGSGAGIALAVGPDGTVTLGWTQLGGVMSGGTAALSRFGPGQTTATTRSLPSPSALGAASPVLGAAPDGSLLVSWLELDSLFNLSVTAARVAPDGTMGPASAVSSTSLSVGLLAVPQPMPGADSNGGALLGVGTYVPVGGGAAWQLDTFRLDLVGPTLTVDVPATATVLTPVHVGAAVVPSDVPVFWDFGDGTRGRGLSVSHVFGGPGVYTVTASATDSAGNETVVTRDITVTTTAAAVGGGPGPVAVPPVVVLPPARAAAVAAALKVAKATRTGAKVTVSGTISSRAKGKVAIVFAQKVGRATVSVKKTATVAKGRWSAVVTLPRSLSKGSAARGKATVTVTFAGTSAVKRASVKHAVSIAKAKKKAPAHKSRG